MIPHNKPSMTAAEGEAVLRQVLSGQLAPGAKVEEFERRMASRFSPGREAIAVSSGSVALMLAATAVLRDNTADCIEVPTYSCHAIFNAMRMVGDYAKKVGAVDADPLTGHAVFEKPDLAVVVHTFGLPAPIPDRLDFIEDASQAAGTIVQGKPAGSFGLASVMSLSAPKPISVGRGGIIFADPDDARFIRRRLDYDCRQERLDIHPVTFGLMDDVRAALGLAQLERLGEMLGRRKEIAQQYSLALPPSLRLVWSSGGEPNWYRYVIKFDTEESRDAATARFYMAGIATSVPITRYDLIHSRSHATAYPGAEDLARSTLSLPIYPDMTHDEVGRVCDVLETL